LAFDPNSTFVPSSSHEPYSTFVPSSIPIMVSSTYDDSENENPPQPPHLPLDESIEPEPTPTPLLPRWVCSTREATGDFVSDPLDQRQTGSQF
jgi:hypothetical protein